MRSEGPLSLAFLVAAVLIVGPAACSEGLATNDKAPVVVPGVAVDTLWLHRDGVDHARVLRITDSTRGVTCYDMDSGSGCLSTPEVRRAP